MGLLQGTNQKLSILQRTGPFKIAFLVVSVLLVSSYLLPASIQSYRFESLGQKIFEALVAADLSKGDPVAVEFVEQGSVTLDGVTYVDDRLASIASTFFDESGRCVAASEATTLLIASQQPDWVPAFILDSPGLTLSFWVAAILWLVLVALFGYGWNLLRLLFVTSVLTIPFWFGSLIYGSINSPPNVEVILALAGISFLAMTFALLTRLALVLLSTPSPTFAIAQSVVREAVRQRVSVVGVRHLNEGLGCA